jgi:hypothetical protein
LSLKLREGHRLRVFENRVLRRIFGLKRDEVTGDWRKLHNEELHNLYPSPIIFRKIKSRRMRWAENVATNGENRNAYMFLVGKLEGKRPLGKPTSGRVILKWILERYDGMAWTGFIWSLDKDQWKALVKTVMNVLVP